MESLNTYPFGGPPINPMLVALETLLAMRGLAKFVRQSAQAHAVAVVQGPA